MARTQDLTRTATAVLGSGGGGTVQLGPAVPGEVWYPTSVSISCTGSQPTPTAPAVATCQVFNGATFVDSTYQVLGASSSMISGQAVYPGSYIYATWANCNSGQTATLTVYGTRKVP